MNRWRLIDTGKCDGRTNMAIDEALLAEFDPASSLPVFRVYGWNPPALSLGRFQKPEEVLDLDRCRTMGVSVVRRVTGGGVIYHADELTYALVCSPGHLPDSGTVKGSFRSLTGFILDFYRHLGLDPSYASESPRPGERLGQRTEFCFAGRESCDILVGGRKIGGNAQRRLRHAVLQHGSIPLVNRAAEGALFLRTPPLALDTETLALHDTGVCPDEVLLRTLLIDAFSAAQAVEFVPSELTSHEREIAESLKVKQ